MPLSIPVMFMLHDTASHEHIIKTLLSLQLSEQYYLKPTDPDQDQDKDLSCAVGVEDGNQLNRSAD